MRCPSCNKFPAYNMDNDPEVDLEVTTVDLALIEDGEHKGSSNADLSNVEVTGNVRIVLTSECCGDELKEAGFEIQESLELARAEGCECDLSDDIEAEGEATMMDRRETMDRKGKPIKNSRYMKTFYGAEMTINIKCACGKSTASLDWSDEIQASAMDELC